MVGALRLLWQRLCINRYHFYTAYAARRPRSAADLGPGFHVEDHPIRIQSVKDEKILLFEDTRQMRVINAGPYNKGLRP